jgi:hypothetical protein
MQQESKRAAATSIPVQVHDVKRSRVCPTFTLVEKGGEAVNCPLEGFLLCSWKKRCLNTGIDGMERRYVEQYGRSKASKH